MGLSGALDSVQVVASASPVHAGAPAPFLYTHALCQRPVDSYAAPVRFLADGTRVTPADAPPVVTVSSVWYAHDRSKDRTAVYCRPPARLEILGDAGYRRIRLLLIATP